MTAADFAKKVDHTILKANATYAEIRETILYAREIGAASVCLNPVHVPLAAELLKGTATKVCTVTGFPLGANTKEGKAEEAKAACAAGAQEIDMVMNISALKSGDHATVRADVAAVVQAVAPVTVKVILENCYLTAEEIVDACRLAEEGGAHYVKTSTGLGPWGAKAEDVELMRKSVSPNVKIKAAGGIATLADAQAMLDAGADRLGLSRTAAILAELEG